MFTTTLTSDVADDVWWLLETFLGKKFCPYVGGVVFSRDVVSRNRLLGD